MTEPHEIRERFTFFVWLRDLDLPPDDQDHEWPAVFAIESTSPAAARAWGDVLATRYAGRTNQDFIRSGIEGIYAGTDLPLVRDGQVVDDTHIGW